ncbi:MAG: ferrous iron transport protein A [Firmicutes bacterium]|nr:ferrous iron transport protein A [Bacillota bacterium]
MLLSELEPGDAGRILSVTGDGALRVRLMEMGLVPGTRVAVRKVAPMGDPMELWLRGYALTLRREDAECVKVEEA